MSIWKDSSAAKPAPKSVPEQDPIALSGASAGLTETASPAPSREPAREMKESVIAAEISIEGKISGSGHVRIAGRFKGDVDVKGDLTIEAGAVLTGSVRANKVILAGELEGNIEAAAHVELLKSGVLNGDLTAGSLTVAAGSRMRGKVEFGWDGVEPVHPRKPATASTNGKGAEDATSA